jgi:hypothetical protein
VSIPGELRNRLSALLGFDITEISGATMRADIPVPDALANRLLAERLPAANLPFSDIHLYALDNDALEVKLTIAGATLMPVVKMAIRIERQPQPNDPVLLLRWSIPGAGPLTLLAGPLLSRLRKLPAGIRMEGEHVAVDIRQLAAQQGMSELLDYVTDLQLHTRLGACVLTVALRVPPASSHRQ